MIPVPPDVTEAVRAIINNRQPAFLSKVRETSDAVRRDFARRGLAGGMVAATLREENTKILEQHVKELLAEVVTLLKTHGEFTDTAAQWLISELGRLVEGLGGVLRGASMDGLNRGAPPGAKEALARDVERRISRIKSQVANEITTAPKVAQLGASRPGEKSQPLPSPTAPLARADEDVVASLKEISLSAAGAYEQGVRDLGLERLNYRGPATEMREALRETLDVLAPVDEVKRQEWYRPVEGRDKPTMAQRARYALRAARKPEEATGAAVRAVEVSEELFAGFVRDVYGRSSVSTHTHAGKAEAEKMRDLIRVVLSDLVGL